MKACAELGAVMTLIMNIHQKKKHDVESYEQHVIAGDVERHVNLCCHLDKIISHLIIKHVGLFELPKGEKLS